MSALIPHPGTTLAPPPDPHFALGDEGMPIYLGETEKEMAEDWDSVSQSVARDQWSLAAIAAAIVVKYGENNLGDFAKKHHTSTKWIRNLAKAYRTFQFGTPVPFLSISHHIAATKATNPVRAVKWAYENGKSRDELKICHTNLQACHALD